MKTRTIILPLILIGCMLAAAGVALLSPPTEAEAEPVVKKQAEKIMKNHVTVAEMESRNKKEESRNIEIAEAVIATITPTPTAEPTPSPTPEITPTPEPVVTEEPPLVTEEVVLVMEEPVLVTEEANDYVEAVNDYEEPPMVDSCFEEPVETGNYYEDIPDATSEVWQYEEPQAQDTGMQYLGDYQITFYSAESCGNSGSANGFGSIPWQTCAAGYDIPFGTIVYVEGVGQFEVRDRGVPSGCIDVFCSSDSEIPSWGLAYLPTYIVAWGDDRTAWWYE